MSDLDAAIQSRLEAWTAERVAERLWAKDGSLWAASGKAPDEISAWLGWLDLPDAMRERVAELEHLARDVREDGYRRAAVLGMGGSSLAPELFSRVFGWAGGDAGSGAASAGALELRVLDSTHPDAVRGFRSWASEQRTLFLRQLQVGLHHRAERLPGRDGRDRAGARFHRDHRSRHAARRARARAGVPRDRRPPRRTSAAATRRSPSSGSCPRRSTASTSPGCWTARARWPTHAERRTRRRTRGCASERSSERPRSPAATSSRCSRARAWPPSATGPSSSSRSRPARRGRASSRSSASRCASRMPTPTTASSFGSGSPARHEPELDALADTLESLGHPVERLELADPLDVGAEFLRWEVATAAAGIVLGIDPFDQPNVQESKDATTELLAAYRTRGALPEPMPLVSEPGVAVTADPASLGDAPVNVDGALAQLLGLARPGIDYFAILAYLPKDSPIEARLQAVRAGIGARNRRGHDARLRPALPALDRAAAQGRTGHRGLPPDHGRSVEGPADPGLAGDVRHAHHRAGARRPRLAPGARTSRHAPARRRCGGRAGPAGRDGRRDAIGLSHEKGARMQVAISGLGRMGAGMARRAARGGHDVSPGTGPSRSRPRSRPSRRTRDASPSPSRSTGSWS